MPTAANAGYYAEIVREKAVLRRLGSRPAPASFRWPRRRPRTSTVWSTVRKQLVYEVTERRASEDFARLDSLLQPTLDEVEAIQGHDGAMTGVPTGFADLDSLTNGLRGGQLVVIAARPAMGKSTLGLDLARAAAIRHAQAAVIFLAGNEQAPRSPCGCCRPRPGCTCRTCAVAG